MLHTTQVCLDRAGLFAATSSRDGWIRIFDWFSGDCVARVRGHSAVCHDAMLWHMPLLTPSVSAIGLLTQFFNPMTNEKLIVS